MGNLSFSPSLTVSLSLSFVFSEVPRLRTRRASALRVQPADGVPDRGHRGGPGSPAAPAASILLILLLVLAAACPGARRLHAGAVADADPSPAVRRPRGMNLRKGNGREGGRKKPSIGTIAGFFLVLFVWVFFVLFRSRPGPYRSALITSSDPILVIVSYICVSH